jgi:hypothetical protein
MDSMSEDQVGGKVGESAANQRTRKGVENKERGRVSTLDINATEETHSAKKEGSWVCQKLRHDPL